MDNQNLLIKQPLSGYAITGFILGLIASLILFIPMMNEIVFIYLLFTILSLIFNIIGLVEIKRKDLKGKPFAIIGLILPFLFLLIVLTLVSGTAIAPFIYTLF